MKLNRYKVRFFKLGYLDKSYIVEGATDSIALIFAQELFQEDYPIRSDIQITITVNKLC